MYKLYPCSCLPVARILAAKRHKTFTVRGLAICVVFSKIFNYVYSIRPNITHRKLNFFRAFFPKYSFLLLSIYNHVQLFCAAYWTARINLVTLHLSNIRNKSFCSRRLFSLSNFKILPGDKGSSKSSGWWMIEQPSNHVSTNWPGSWREGGGGG